MTNVVVVGLQWGDEGKGRIVDWLSESVDVVVRFQGGHNAGHTLVVDGKTYKLSLIPSGVVREGKLGLIGNGVVIDPYALISEIETLEKQGIRIDSSRLGIADNATLILSVHRELDALREDAAADLGTGIGTTRRGIGPAYEDKAGRRAIRVMDLDDPKTLTEKIDRLLVHHNALRRGLGQPEVSSRRINDELTAVAERILPFCKKVWRLLDREIKKGARILFEGAQGVLLDVDHGTYPFVTSSNTVSGQFSSGTGLGPGTVSHVMGIAKAYTTRVGEGPFPTELFDDTRKALSKRGNEFGTVTGRSRRCGWFDAVLARQAVSVSGVNGIALTKLDVMDGFEEIKICVGYELDGEKIDYLPAGQEQQAEVKPVYQTFEGWKGGVAGVRSWEDLPIQAINYVKNVEKLIGVPVMLLTTSPERADTVLVHDPFQS